MGALQRGQDPQGHEPPWLTQTWLLGTACPSPCTRSTTRLCPLCPSVTHPQQGGYGVCPAHLLLDISMCPHTPRPLPWVREPLDLLSYRRWPIIWLLMPSLYPWTAPVSCGRHCRARCASFSALVVAHLSATCRTHASCLTHVPLSASRTHGHVFLPSLCLGVLGNSDLSALHADFVMFFPGPLFHPGFSLGDPTCSC